MEKSIEIEYKIDKIFMDRDNIALAAIFKFNSTGKFFILNFPAKKLKSKNRSKNLCIKYSYFI